MEANKGRVIWIDQLRGIAIFLVILGHVNLPGKLNGFIYSFHMPLFFMITGLTMNNHKLSRSAMKEYMLCQIKHLLIPYFWMSFMMYPLWYLAFHWLGKTSLTIPQAFYGILVGNSLLYASPSNALWFVLVLMIAKIVYVFFYKMTKGSKVKMLVLIIICAFGGLAEQGKARIWHLNVVFTAVVFIYIGNCMMQWYQKNGKVVLQKMSKRKSGIILFFMVILGISSAYLNGRVSMHRNTFGKSVLLYYFTAVVLSSICMLSIIKFMPTKVDSKSMIVYIGQNTLLYVGFHIPIIRVLEQLLSDSLTQYGWSILEAVVIYCVLALFCILVNRWFPFVSGKEVRSSVGSTIGSKALLVMWCLWIPYMYIMQQSGLDLKNKSIGFVSMISLLAVSLMIVKCAKKYFPIVFLED